MPADDSAQTIRVLYALQERVYVGGVETANTVTYRVARLSTASWPAVTVVADEPVASGGPAVTALNLTASRDGSRVA